MLKLKVLGKVLESGLVAIVRTNSSDQAAAHCGGLRSRRRGGN